MDSKQLGAFSKAELELIKFFVASREDATLILRNHFLQLEVTKEEKTFLKSLSSETIAVLKRCLIPSLTREVPLTVEGTMYSRLSFIGQYSTEGAILHIHVNDLFIRYFDQQFNLLQTDEEPTIILEDLPKELGIDQDEMRVINMLAFNEIIVLTEERILNIQKIGAPPEKENEDDKIKRLKKDSSK